MRNWGLAACVLVVLLFPAQALTAAPAADRLPDLAMAPLRDLQIQVTSGNRRLLRFTAEIVNLGAGPFELRGSRAAGESLMTTVVQRIYDDAGGSRTVATPAVMFFAGDGHTHWHVNDLEKYELVPLGITGTVGLDAKIGFCFFDILAYRLSLPGAPQSAHYIGCGSSSALAVTMGLSVGWGDVYQWSLPGQYIDITGLPPGTYRLRAIADPSHWFVEQDNTRNDTWLDLAIAGQTVRILNRSAYIPALMH